METLRLLLEATAFAETAPIKRRAVAVVAMSFCVFMTRPLLPKVKRVTDAGSVQYRKVDREVQFRASISLPPNRDDRGIATAVPKPLRC